MLLKHTRFGEIEVPGEKIITMTRPILGFEKLRTFCLIELDELKPFLWLQSIENESIGFVVVNPVVFFPEYRIEVNIKEVADLSISRVEMVETYVIVTFPGDPREMSANLQGPILINTENSQGRQLVLVNSRYSVNHSLMDALDEMSEETRQLDTVGA
ncbi:flagellar assembly protein FliW [candidate division GN15 bacterium]|nr:flagellar assembly protein FliW [candidate division GN15 bacterium]